MGYPTSALLRVNVVSKSELQEEWPPVERLLFKGGNNSPKRDRQTDGDGEGQTRTDEAPRKQERERAN